MDLKKLEQQFYEAKARCVALKEGEPTNIAEEMMHWLLNSDINPYGVFVSEDMAFLTRSIQGLDQLLNRLEHALLDDGEICFVEVRGEPRVVFLQPNDFDSEEEFWEEVFKHDDFAGNRMFPPERKIIECTVKEFIERSEAYEALFLKKCFILEAGKNLDKAIKKYEGENRFDVAWIDEVKT